MDDVKLAIIGRERSLIDKLTRQLWNATKRYHNYGVIHETRRGNTFEVQILVDDKPTGHVARVTVELDRFEPPRESH